MIIFFWFYFVSFCFFESITKDMRTKEIKEKKRKKEGDDEKRQKINK